MLLLLAALPLGGCELMAMGPFMPGLVPGVGFALQGNVRDGRTFLPIGGATVTSGLGSTVTDANGHFALYGNLGSHEFSVSRMGYVATTVGGIKADASTPLDVTLDATTSDNGALPQGFLDVRGFLQNVGGQPIAVPNGVVVIGDRLPTAASNGQYQVTFESQVPGKVLTRVLAGGDTAERWDDAAAKTSFLPMTFKTFGYSLEHFTLMPTQGQQTSPRNLTVDDSIKFDDTKVAYSNIGDLKIIETSIYLDFGVAGSVLVAQATGSNQGIHVPVVPGVKYVVIGTAYNANRTQWSNVTITTADPRKAPFQLLTPPKVTGGVGKGIGSRPTLKWTPSPVPGVVYEVTMKETDDKGSTSVTKWRATTTEPEITYPGFSLSDVNSGALRPEKKYVWSVRVIDTLSTMEDATTHRAILDVKPLRTRSREAVSTNNEFTI
jgi:hypothetical protein